MKTAEKLVVYWLKKPNIGIKRSQ